MTTTTSNKNPEFSKTDFAKMLKRLKELPEPEGLIVLPSADGYSLYKYPARIIKLAIALASDPVVQSGVDVLTEVNIKNAKKACVNREKNVE
jgi:ABC-type phosphate transport system auxiliary subunit